MSANREELKRIEVELDLANQARNAGNEGRARVCARRAAGWAAGRFWAVQRDIPAPKSAYTLLLWLSGASEVPEAIRQAAHRLTVRVGSDQQLPHKQDPLEDAQAVVAWCREGRRPEGQS